MRAALPQGSLEEVVDRKGKYVKTVSQALRL